MESATAYVVDRDLIAADLDRIASALSPRIVSLLESMLEAGVAQMEASPLEVGVGPLKMRVGPWIARWLRSEAPGSLPSQESVAAQLSSVLREALTLPDPVMSALCEAGATELGAWVGQADPVPDAAWAQLELTIGMVGLGATD
jgi:hypothetical protein